MTSDSNPETEKNAAPPGDPRGIPIVREMGTCRLQSPKTTIVYVFSSHTLVTYTKSQVGALECPRETFDCHDFPKET